MKRPGLQTQNQRNKRKDGDADRWPDASFFPLNEGGREKTHLLSSIYQTKGDAKKRIPFHPYIKRGGTRKKRIPFHPYIKRRGGTRKMHEKGA